MNELGNGPETDRFIAAAMLLVCAAVAATVIPAWRASRTQPMRVLREE